MQSRILRLVSYCGSLLFLSAIISCSGGGAVISVGQLGVLSSVISQIQKALSSAIAQADDATKSQISRVDTTARDNIKRLNDLVDHAGNTTAEQREEAARQGFAVLADSQKLVSDSGKDVFANLNQTLASVSSTLDAIPFVNIPDTVFAVSPYKLKEDARDREVSVYGYFPSIAEDSSAVAVTVDGTPVQIKRSAGKFFFDLPSTSSAQTNAYSNVKIQLPKKHWYSSAQTPVEARIHILNKTPYTFVIDVSKDNASAFATLEGKPHTEGADSSNTNRNVHLDAIGLFNTSVGDPKYDAATAQIVKVRQLPSTSGKACADCPDPSGSIPSWTASAVEIALNAPNCDKHFVTTYSTGPFGIRIPGGYVCGGGGSHFEVIFAPTFTVQIKGVPVTIPIDSRTIKSGTSSVSTIDLPSDWTSAVVKASFDDNFDKATTLVVVKKAVPVASSAAFDVRVENNKLLISTR